MARWREYTGPTEGRFRVAGGALWVREGLHSPQLGNERDILVYLPPSYAATDANYPVLYMHDGQNLFDPRTSHAGEWGVDDAIVAAGAETIVVGIPNAGDDRLNEYSPFPDARLGGGDGDDYVAFLTETVKPLIDRTFRTLPGRDHTGIAGSSMGGLISAYAFFARPDVFGVAGVMSPSLWFGRGAFFRYLDDSPFVRGRLYLDIGTIEGEGMVANARLLRQALVAKGYRPGRDLHYVEAEAGHNEAAWASRFQDALPFLLNRPDRAPILAQAAD